MTRQMILRGVAAIVLVASSHFAGQPAGAVQITAYQQAVAENLSGDDKVAEFYRARDFEPIWTGGTEADLKRRAALFEALSMAGHHGLPVEKYNTDRLLSQMAAVRGGYERGAVEVALTGLYLDLATDLQTGVIDNPRRVRSGIVRDIPHRDAEYYLTGVMSDNPRAFLDSLAPKTLEYSRLMRAKMELETRIARGGWGASVPPGKYQPGDTGAGVIALRDRLVAMGYMKRTVIAQYNSTMTEAVRSFQKDHGLTVDGVAGGDTLSQINSTVQDRLKSVMVAMERERWINKPDGLGNRHVLVNITDFQARLFDDGKLTFETRSVVGHPDRDRQTPEFSDVMDHMVINPTWYIPRSIIVGEYLPKLRRNSNAVSHLNIVDSRGRIVGRGQSFAGYTERNFPFSMRQPPGPRNALGSVKFMFPNKYNIYLHDTPSQSLFSREVRTFSHGCVRLNDPHEFAYALLSKQTDDPVGFFQSRLQSRSELRVDLEQPVPVHLIYRTAFTTAKEGLQFRRDVYGRDAAIWDALSAAGVAIRGIQS